MSAFNKTPQGERLHIGIFGKCNVGKSTLLNAITKQETSVVSPIKGTTTDPVFKAMELLPVGPVLFIDTPGIDDGGQLGGLRIEKAKNILRKVDIAILVVGISQDLSDEDRDLISTFEKYDIKYLIVYNKDVLSEHDFHRTSGILVNALTGENIDILKERIMQTVGTDENKQYLISDLLEPGDIVVLVMPIDKSAPKGRLILPQQQVIRDILEAGAVSVITTAEELKWTLEKVNTPKMVVTDSQAFAQVSKDTGKNIALTSFSILMARYKGILNQAVQGVKAIDTLKDGDTILISEGCTHHRQCDDIGTVKLPRMIEKYTKIQPKYEFSSGGSFAQDLSKYKMVIHCGGCMLNNREMVYRHKLASEAGVPITNYGVAMSYMQGILDRCIAPVK